MWVKWRGKENRGGLVKEKEKEITNKGFRRGKKGVGIENLRVWVLTCI